MYKTRLLFLTLFLFFGVQNMVVTAQEGIQPMTTCENSIYDDKDTPKEIFRVVENMPSFAGCESISDKKKRETCSSKKIKEFIAANLKYPEEARTKMIEGEVVVKFIITEEGCLADIVPVRGIGAGCDEEAQRIVSLMPNWNPGKQRSRVVPVMYYLPIQFEL